MKRYLKLPVSLILFACMAIFAGCGTKTQVVLLPESDGRILVESHGEGNPLIPTADEVSEPRNRRAEVVIR